jgi:hypothetical protein
VRFIFTYEAKLTLALVENLRRNRKVIRREPEPSLSTFVLAMKVR